MFFKNSLNINIPISIGVYMGFGSLMAKVTTIHEYAFNGVTYHFSKYGFNFFPKISALSGFGGSTHFISTFIVYYFVLYAIVFLIKLGIKDIVKSYKRKKEIKMIKDFESGRANLKWYQKIPLISKFFSWYKKGMKIWFSNKVDRSYNFGSFIFFNFMLVNIDFFIIAQSSIS